MPALAFKSGTVGVVWLLTEGAASGFTKISDVTTLVQEHVNTGAWLGSTDAYWLHKVPTPWEQAATDGGRWSQGAEKPMSD